MPTPVLVVIMLIVASVASAYTTARICNREYESEWLIIKLKNDEVEPTYIFVCKECHAREEFNCRYCKNCGRRMRNGIRARLSYPEDIEI